MSTPSALLLLADHIKLSLLERQRAKSLKLHSDSQDGHLSRSLEQFRDGLESLTAEHARLAQSSSPDQQAKATALADTLASLHKQYHDLTSQFHGFASPAMIASTLTSPNDPALAADFAHAQSSTSETTSTSLIDTSPTPSLLSSSSSSSSSSPPPPPPPSSSKPPPPTKKSPSSSTPAAKTVRFSDHPLDLEAQLPPLPHNQSQSSSHPNPLFPYRDDPSAADTAGYRDEISSSHMSNVQVHSYHRRILEEQDAQLDALGASIGRQRELSMQIGDELDEQVLMLDESDRVVDRHQSTLDRARRQMGRIARSASEGGQMTVIVVLIIVLVLLIAVLK
ncbi:hypothetical protein B0T17DRAFT_649891 [Bombardia bombarda]|uniref:t-SNARE coiled-coil homology domain-containing protein n=1 Tax=Bombardia bombarda TaxID=252184 RepID=A0AA39XJD6_9PEZI|nr:hypothetical protein B0T17DRAFT_649891 [Bombardia bombarda]